MDSGQKADSCSPLLFMLFIDQACGGGADELATIPVVLIGLASTLISGQFVLAYLSTGHSFIPLLHLLLTTSHFAHPPTLS